MIFITCTRFADDVYDRIWKPAESIQGTRYLTSNQTINTNNLYKPPQTAMRSAITPSDSTSNLNFSIKADLSTDKYFFCLHIAELQNLTGSKKTREFEIFLNNNVFSGTMTSAYLGYLSTSTAFSRTPRSAQKFDFSMRSLANWTLPPLLNAYEVYKLNPLSQMETNATDGM